MDAFVKQIPVSETIFGNIKKPPDIICVVVFKLCIKLVIVVILCVSYFEEYEWPGQVKLHPFDFYLTYKFFKNELMYNLQAM